MTASSEPQPSRLVLDHVLQRAPIHAFILDRDLVCRYAAPVGERFLGLARESLLGQDIGDILPPARNGLRPALERAAHEGTSWTYPKHVYRHHAEGRDALYVWAVCVEPVPLRDQRGVFLALQDIAEHETTRARLESEVERLRAVLGILERQAAARRQSTRDLCSKVRNVLAPISGYLQVIARHPATLTAYTVPEVIEQQVLPQLGDLVDLIDQFDAAAEDDGERYVEADPRA